MLAIGRPIGTAARTASGRQAHQVTSTAASVGPYRLCSSARERSKNRCCKSARQRLAAADHARQTRRTDRQRGSSSNACSIDGTKCSVVIRSAAMSVARGSPDRGGRPGARPRAWRRHQRPEELPDRHVEAERRLLQHAVGRVERGTPPASRAAGCRSPDACSSRPSAAPWNPRCRSRRPDDPAPRESRDWRRPHPCRRSHRVRPSRSDTRVLEPISRSRATNRSASCGCTSTTGAAASAI